MKFLHAREKVYKLLAFRVNLTITFILLSLASCTPSSLNSQRDINPPEAISDATVQNMESRPNFLFILADDLDLLLGTIDFMPHLQKEIIGNGITFENSFITTPICCPARVSFLKGQYAHNHEIYTNNPPSGGFPKFALLQTENSTLATWLQQAGYHTALLGKYLNAYPIAENREHLPPGWNDWYFPVVR